MVEIRELRKTMRESPFYEILMEIKNVHFSNWANRVNLNIKF